MGDLYLNGKFQPNFFVDFADGKLKCNRLSETMVSADPKDSVIPMEVYSDGAWNDVPNYKIPTFAYQLSLNKCVNCKVNIGKSVIFEDVIPDGVDYRFIGRRAYYSDTSANPLANRQCFEQDFSWRPFLVCMPNTAPIKSRASSDSSLIDLENITEGAKCTIIVEQNADFAQRMTANLAVSDIDIQNGENVGHLKSLESYVNDCVLLCADPRVFTPHAYRLFELQDEEKDYGILFAPETEPHADQDAITHVAALKAYFRVNNRLTKFLVVSPGSVVKFSARIEQSPLYNSTADENGNYAIVSYEDVIIWYVENSSSFQPAKVTVSCNLGYEGYSFLYNGTSSLQSTANPNTRIDEEIVDYLSNIGPKTDYFGSKFNPRYWDREPYIYVSKNLREVSDKYDDYNGNYEHVNIEIGLIDYVNTSTQDWRYYVNRYKITSEFL